MHRWISIENRAGDPIIHRDITITPFSQVFRIDFPGVIGGLTWHRPSSILVKTTSDEENIYPVPDVTRLAQWWLLGACLGAAIFFWLISRRQRNN